MLNDLVLQFGAAGFKPLLTALLLPPVPPLVLVLLGGTLRRRHPGWGGLLLLVGAAGIWFGSTTAVGEWLQHRLLQMPPPLHAAELQAQGSADTAVLVLGGGREIDAPEFGAANLTRYSLERLRYGLWLARQAGLPVGFSGGVGHAQVGGVAEADIAARIAAQEFGHPLRWVESASRDTRENAERSVALLRAAGVKRIVLVTHGWHMPRSLRAFEHAVARSGGGIALRAAPMGLARDTSIAPLRWLPSQDGFADTRNALREYLGLLAGA
ncbi:MAG TPA: YdcF family protein [Rubrivivax sp.]|nr:YdcF family protein [Rubrivivax sp.]